MEQGTPGGEVERDPSRGQELLGGGGQAERPRGIGEELLMRLSLPPGKNLPSSGPGVGAAYPLSLHLDPGQVMCPLPALVSPSEKGQALPCTEFLWILGAALRARKADDRL